MTENQVLDRILADIDGLDNPMSTTTELPDFSSTASVNVWMQKTTGQRCRVDQMHDDTYEVRIFGRKQLTVVICAPDLARCTRMALAAWNAREEQSALPEQDESAELHDDAFGK